MKSAFDKVDITVQGGDGGRGVVSFRREKFVPMGGPDGGDGGSGGKVRIIADSAYSSLSHISQGKLYKAFNGEPGGKSRKSGKNGSDIEIGVPIGTLVQTKDWQGNATVLADLDKAGDSFVAASGGRGGLGNTHFASSTNQAPRLAQKGQEGENREVTLEMKLIADVGIIGYPNVGKSSLLAAVSAAKPKIAAYPFTTIDPVLGVVNIESDVFTIVEVPGLIEMAYLGKGLGHDFLRHVNRTRLLIHLLDGNSNSPPLDLKNVNQELVLFDSSMAEIQQIVAINKIDLPGVRRRISGLKNKLESLCIKPFFVSALSGEGITELMSGVAQKLKELPKRLVSSRGEEKVFHPKPINGKTSISKDGEIWQIDAPDIERIIDGSNIADQEVRRQIFFLLMNSAIGRTLKKSGIRAGDKVRLGRLEWVW
jgi:GTP-binding protein